MRDVQRPTRILLVTHDDAFATTLADHGAAAGAQVRRASHDDDLELVAFEHGPDVVAVDTDEGRRRRIRVATAFAATHPGATVVLLASSPAANAVSGLPLVAKAPAQAALRTLSRSRILH